MNFTNEYALSDSTKKLRWLARSVITILFMTVVSASAQGQPSQLAPYVQNGSYIIAGTSPPLTYRERDLFIPASTLKILTSIAALDLLGRNYRFQTHFFIDSDQNLYVKGYGDPLLTSENLLKAAEQLKNAGVNKVNSLYLDNSAFDLTESPFTPTLSTNPYDAPNGSLAVNFNTLPLFVQKDGTVSSGEPQTPTLPIMLEYAKKHLPGIYRLNISGPTVTREMSQTVQLRYTAELLTAMLRKVGINVAKSYSARTVPAGLEPVIKFQSPSTLSEIIRDCLKYSNNFIANQLFLACGMYKYGSPATWQKGRNFMAAFIENRLDLYKNEIVAIEGSGLSKENRLSGMALVKILEMFQPYANLMTRKGYTLMKSGTLEGVYCYAGYFITPSELIPFALFLNQPQNSRDKVLRILRKQFLQQQKVMTNSITK